MSPDDMETREDPVSDDEWRRFSEQIDEALAADGFERPVVDPGREDWMRRWMADAASPEEWVAHYSQDLVVFDGGDYTYSDPAVDAWVRRLDAVLSSRLGIDLCRRRFLSVDDLRAVRARAAEEL